MSELDDKVKEAIKAYKAKKRSAARDILMEVVDRDEKHEQGWLYLSLVVDSKQEQQICLENVLAINPNNQQARQALEVLNKKLGDPPPPPPPQTPSSAPPTISGFGSLPDTADNDDGGTISSWGDIDTSSAGFGDSGTPPSAASGSAFPSPSSDSTSPLDVDLPPTAPPAGDAAGWFNDMESPWQTDASDPATSGSVDFGGIGSSPADPAEPGYSYGRSGVDTSNEFSSNELDSWISEMGIRGTSNSAPTPAPEPTTPATNDPFAGIGSGGQSGSAFDDFDWGASATSDSDDSGFGGWDDDFASLGTPTTPAEPAQTPSSTPASGSAFDAGWDQMGTNTSSAFDNSPFDNTLPADDPAPTPVSEPSGGSLFGADDDEPDTTNTGSIFPSYEGDSSMSLFEDDDVDDMASILGETSDLSDIDGLDESGEIRADAAAMEYLSMIPNEIQAVELPPSETRKRDKKRGGIGLGVVVLALLNIGLAAMAFMQFSSM